MQTVLDESRHWFLESLKYDDELRVVVIEGIVGDTPEQLQVGEIVVEDVYPIEPTARSRRVAVRFPRTVAWQVVDESYTSFDESEVRDDEGILSVFTQSAYLQFVQTHHGWWIDLVGPAAHYRLWTEDEVVDVVAHDEPVVEPLSDAVTAQSEAMAEIRRLARRSGGQARPWWRFW